MKSSPDTTVPLRSVALTADENFGALGILAFGEFVEIYSATATVRMQNLSAGGPSAQAPAVMTNEPGVGSRHPIVARVLLQSSELIENCGISEKGKTRARLALLSCKDALLACEKTSAHVASQVNAVCDHLRKNGLVDQGNSLHLPQVDALKENVSAYLINLKRSIKAICDVVREIVELEGKGNSNFDKLGKALETKYGDHHNFVKFVKHHAPQVRYIIIFLRNNDEHAGGDDTFTIVRNFHLGEDRTIKAPTWHLEGKVTTTPQWIANEMVEFVRLVQMLAESAVILAVRARIRDPFVVVQIPEEQISPDWPIAWRLTIDPSKVHSR